MKKIEYNAHLNVPRRQNPCNDKREKAKAIDNSTERVLKCFHEYLRMKSSLPSGYRNLVV